MERKKEIRMVSVRFMSWVALITLLATLACWGYMDYTETSGLYAPMAVSAAFSIVVSLAETLIWQKIVISAPDYLAVFHTSVSGFRLLLALATMFVYYLASGRENMTAFILVFMLYYFMVLAYHAIHFSRLARIYYHHPSKK